MVQIDDVLVEESNGYGACHVEWSTIMQRMLTVSYDDTCLGIPGKCPQACSSVVERPNWDAIDRL
jgi:hypothetical protein